MYSPTLGRFIQLDPVETGENNKYMYIHNSPLNGVDPLGLFGYQPQDYAAAFAAVSGLNPLSFDYMYRWQLALNRSASSRSLIQQTTVPSDIMPPGNLTAQQLNAMANALLDAPLYGDVFPNLFTGSVRVIRPSDAYQCNDYMARVLLQDSTAGATPVGPRLQVTVTQLVALTTNDRRFGGRLEKVNLGPGNSSLMPGYQKLAVYGQDDGAGKLITTHVAVQMPDGKWRSKLGNAEPLIEHDRLEQLEGPRYGQVSYLWRFKTPGC